MGLEEGPEGCQKSADLTGDAADAAASWRTKSHPAIPGSLERQRCRILSEHHTRSRHVKSKSKLAQTVARVNLPQCQAAELKPNQNNQMAKKQNEEVQQVATVQPLGKFGAAMEGKAIGSIIEVDGQQFEVALIHHGLRHETHGPREDGKSGFASKKYGRRFPLPKTVEGAVSLFGQSELIALAVSKFQYDSQARSVAEITTRLDSGLPVEPSAMSPVIPGEYATSMKSKATKADEARAAEFDRLTAGHDLAKIRSYGGIQPAEDMSILDKSGWVKAREEHILAQTNDLSL